MLCPFFCFLKFLLSLTELCQIESSNLLSLLNLLLVSLDLHLQLSSKLRHAILVLPVLSLSKSKLLALALSTLEGLSSFTSARLGCCKFRLKLPKLVCEGILCRTQRSGMILFCTKLIGKTCSIDHGFLGFLLSIFGSYKHTINLCLQCVNAGFQLALRSHVTSIDSLHIVNSSTSISNISLQLMLSTVGTIKKCLAFLNFS